MARGVYVDRILFSDFEDDKALYMVRTSVCDVILVVHCGQREPRTGRLLGREFLLLIFLAIGLWNDWESV